MWESPLGRFYFQSCTEEGMILLWYYILGKKKLRKVKETKRREREREWKEPWEISFPISQAPLPPCSSHSAHWLSIAAANLLGEKPHTGKKWNHLNSSTHTYPTAPAFSSPPSPPLFSSLQSPCTSKAWKRNMDTRSVASLPPHSSFNATASRRPPLTPGFLSCANSVWKREKEGKW